MWVKICGINHLETAVRIAECGPNAIGLNFYAGTPRFVQPETAREIVRQLPPNVTPVGLFVNHAVSDVLALCEMTGISTVQIHGDESPDWLAELASANPRLRIIRAFRVGDQGLDHVVQYLQDCALRQTRLWACLIDARHEGQYGGTGKQAPWDLIHAQYDQTQAPPLILAGGLNAENVAEAVNTVQPWGVDVASGVELPDGRKDIEAVRRFLQNARTTN